MADGSDNERRKAPLWVAGILAVILMGVTVWLVWLTIGRDGAPPPGVPVQREKAGGDPRAQVPDEAWRTVLPAGDLLPPTRVTLSLRDVPARQAVQLLSESAGISISADDEGVWERPWVREARVTLELEKEPFWSALWAVCSQAKLIPASAGPATGVLLIDSPHPLSQKTVSVGPLFFVLEEITRGSTLDPLHAHGGWDRRRHEVSAEVLYLAEPGSGMLSALSRVTTVTAVDGAGRRLGSERAESSLDRTDGVSPWMGRFRFGLVTDERPVGPWRELAAGVRIVTASHLGEFSFRNLAEGQTQEDYGYSMTFHDMQRHPQAILVRISFSDAKGGELWREYRGLTQHFSLYDGQGQMIRPMNAIPNPNWLEVQFMVGLQFEPVRFVATLPVGVRATEVPVRFTDVPIP